MDKTEEFKANMSMLADMLDGNVPAIGTEIPMEVARGIKHLDLLSGINELRRCHIPKDILPPIAVVEQ